MRHVALFKMTRDLCSSKPSRGAGSPDPRGRVFWCHECGVVDRLLLDIQNRTLKDPARKCSEIIAVLLKLFNEIGCVEVMFKLARHFIEDLFDDQYLWELPGVRLQFTFWSTSIVTSVVKLSPYSSIELSIRFSDSVVVKNICLRLVNNDVQPKVNVASYRGSNGRSKLGLSPSASLCLTLSKSQDGLTMSRLARLQREAT